MTVPIDRSMPPVMITKVTPSARMPLTDGRQQDVDVVVERRGSAATAIEKKTMQDDQRAERQQPLDRRPSG